MEEAAQVGVSGSWAGAAALFVDCALGPAGVGCVCVYRYFADSAADSCCWAGAFEGWQEAG